MTKNEQIIRKLYQIAEDKDFSAFANFFGENGLFVDMSSGATFRGKDTGQPVALYAAAFPDMHRELGRFTEQGDTVVVELTLRGTHDGALQLPQGHIAPTHRKIEVPCCDVFVIAHEKVALFRCYNLASVLLAQLGVLESLGASLIQSN